MGKITIEDLARIAEKVKKTTALRDGEFRAKITVHMGTCGISAGARPVMNSFLSEIEKRDINDVILTNSGCAGLCSREPMVTVELAGNAPVKYVDVTPEKAVKILVEHVLDGKIVQEYALGKGSERQY